MRVVPHSAPGVIADGDQRRLGRPLQQGLLEAVPAVDHGRVQHLEHELADRPDAGHGQHPCQLSPGRAREGLVVSLHAGVHGPLSSPAVWTVWRHRDVWVALGSQR